MAIALMAALLVLYHVNGGFLPGRDATPNLYLPLTLWQGNGLSFQPDDWPQMFRWHLRSGEEIRPQTAHVPSWQHPVDPKSLAWLARAGSDWPPCTWGDLRDRGVVTLARPEYYLVPSVDPETRGYVNQYGPGAGLTAMPVLAILDLVTGGLADHGAALWYGGKFVAALCVAASAAIVFLTLTPLVGRKPAAAISVVYGVGTCVWSVASQSLWQSGPELLFMSAAAFCLLRVTRGTWWAVACGAAAGWAVVCRPTAGLLVLAIAGYLAALAVHRLRKSALTPDPSPAAGRGEPTDADPCPAAGRGESAPRRPVAWAVRPLAAFVAGVLPSAVFLGAYNAYYLGSPLRFGQIEAGRRLAEDQLGAAHAWAGPFWESFYGLLVSPSRGLLVYSPILVFAGWGMVRVWLDKRFERLRPLSVAAVLLLLLQAKWFNWHGGWSFGYRLLIDAMPLAALCSAACAAAVSRRRAWLGAAAVLFAWSLGVQVLGAFAYDVVGWNCREGLVVRTPDGAAIPVRDAEHARDVAAKTGGAAQKVYMDVDRRAWHARLWSVRDNPLAYYATHFSQSREVKRRLIEETLAPP